MGQTGQRRRRVGVKTQHEVSSLEREWGPQIKLATYNEEKQVCREKSYFNLGHTSFERSPAYLSRHIQSTFRNRNLYFGRKVRLAFITEKGTTHQAFFLLNFSQVPVSPPGFNLGLQCPLLSGLHCRIIAKDPLTSAQKELPIFDIWSNSSSQSLISSYPGLSLVRVLLNPFSQNISLLLMFLLSSFPSTDPYSTPCL